MLPWWAVEKIFLCLSLSIYTQVHLNKLEKFSQKGVEKFIYFSNSTQIVSLVY